MTRAAVGATARVALRHRWFPQRSAGPAL